MQNISYILGGKVGRNINNLIYADDTTLMAEKEPHDESERGEWKVDLKLNIQKTKIMASGPITSWQIDGETVETVFYLLKKQTLSFGAPKSLKMRTAAMKLKGACSLEEKLWPT